MSSILKRLGKSKLVRGTAIVSVVLVSVKQYQQIHHQHYFKRNMQLLFEDFNA